MKGLYNKKVEKACAHCHHGKISADGSDVLCLKKGVMLKTSNCKHYEYDALKRVPNQHPKIPEHSIEEFTL